MSTVNLQEVRERQAHERDQRVWRSMNKHQRELMLRASRAMRLNGQLEALGIACGAAFELGRGGEALPVDT